MLLSRCDAALLFFVCWLVARRGDAKSFRIFEKGMWNLARFPQCSRRAVFCCARNLARKNVVVVAPWRGRRKDGERRGKKKTDPQDREAPTCAPWRRKEDRGRWSAPIVCDFLSLQLSSILLIKFVFFLLFPLPP